jgi:hypothetical protein
VSLFTVDHTGAITVRHDVYVHMADEETTSIATVLGQIVDTLTGLTTLVGSVVAAVGALQAEIHAAQTSEEQLAGLEKSLDEGASDLESVSRI